MNVLVISGMYPTKTDASYGIYVKDTVDSLKKYNNIDSHVIASVTQMSGLITTPFKYIDVFLRTILALFSRRKFDIIHAHYIFPAGLFALIPKYLLKQKLIVTAHGSDINILPYRNVFFHNITRFILRRSDMITTVSRPLKEEIINEFKIDENKIMVIPCGMDPELFRPMDRNLCREILGLPRNKRIIFHLSSLEPVKRVGLLIESYKLVTERHKDSILIIGGYGKEQSQLLKLVEKLNLSENVIFTGAIPKHDVPTWMNASNAFILTSKSEGTPITLLEAMGVGTNIIATEVGGIPDVVGELGILIKNPTPQNIAESISSVFSINEVNYRKQRIMKSNRYHWAKISQEISDLYKTIV